MDTICVGMSGGIDSSVAASLLVQQGYRVIGMMLRLWSEENLASENQCFTPESIGRAKRVSAQMGIPFYVIDARNEFRKKVVDYFLESHQNSETPNPCYFCNRDVKWEIMMKNAFVMGAKFLATGHYAQLNISETGEIELSKAKDLQKDQSYIISGLSFDHLKQTKFPLGGLIKSEVRELASKLKLDSFDAMESQDLCFLGSLRQEQFIKKYSNMQEKLGEIILSDGSIIGMHKGLFNFTIGQRKGIKISGKSSYYVIDKDKERNRLIVGFKNEINKSRFLITRINWLIQTIKLPMTVSILCRYHGVPNSAVINYEKAGPDLVVDLQAPINNLTPGQVAVIYDGPRVIGSGIIKNM